MSTASCPVTHPVWSAKSNQCRCVTVETRVFRLPRIVEKSTVQSRAKFGHFCSRVNPNPVPRMINIGRVEDREVTASGRYCRCCPDPNILIIGDGHGIANVTCPTLFCFVRKARTEGP